MSGTQSMVPPGLSAALRGGGAPPAPSPGMGGAPGGGNALQIKFQQTVQSVTQIIQILAKLPMVNQEKLKEAVVKLQEGMVLIAEAVKGMQNGAPGGAPGMMPPASAQPPMGGVPPQAPG